MNGWKFLSVFVFTYLVCEAYLTSKGLDTYFWVFRTPPELQLQQALINKANCTLKDNK